MSYRDVGEGGRVCFHVNTRENVNLKPAAFVEIWRFELHVAGLQSLPAPKRHPLSESE